MSKIIYGIDPDSNRCGIAVYRDGILTELLNMNAIQLYIHLTAFEKVAIDSGNIEIHIENVKKSKAVWHAQGMNKSVAAMAAQKVGMCKQAQTSIEQLAEELNIPVVHHRASSMWKNQSGKKDFERITGWKGRSNEDSRSGAFMGYQGVRMRHKSQ